MRVYLAVVMGAVWQTA